MTLGHLATFAESSDGKTYRDVCDRFGVDPARDIEDGVMAHQFRLALLIAHPPEVPEELPTDPFQEARDAAAKVRAMT